ncbi:MAG: alpha/beta hydrolase [Thiolinea sp.]
MYSALFCCEDWDNSWPPYSIETHASDLLAFLEAIKVENVHIVAWSSGSHIALRAAQKSPQSIRAIFMYEPVVPSYVENEQTLQMIGEDAHQMVGPAVKQLEEHNMNRAAELFLDGVANQPGYFKALDEHSQRIVLDNARMLPLMLNGGEQDAPISCKQLKDLKPKIFVAYGEHSEPFFG